jgi:hypothetical protein
MRSLAFWMIVSVVCLCLFISSSTSAKTPPANPSSQAVKSISAQQTVPTGYASSAMDTFFVAIYRFDDPVTGAPDPQGWFPVDLTAQLGTYFHVDTFNVPSGGGTKAMWCGARPDTSEPLCRYATLPGYGNYWDQSFTSIAFPHSGDVTVSYVINHDVEPGYDYVNVQYKDPSDTWTVLISYDGSAQNVTGAHVISSEALPGSVQVRFNFSSDGSWSDEDGLWDTTAGACQIDNIALSDTTGVIDTQDFEAEAVGALETLDGHWRSTTPLGFGTFAALYPGSIMPQDGPCVFNTTSLWAFINGSTAYGCGDLANEIVVPFTNERGQALDAAIESPVIDLTKDINNNPIPSDADRLVLIFDRYVDLPLDNLVFFKFGWRQYHDGADNCGAQWTYNQFFLHSNTARWSRFSDEEYVLPVTAPAVRIRLRALDLFPIHYGSGDCHTAAPYFDNVRLVRIRSRGPSWLWLPRSPSYALFNDAFPTDGTATGTVRMDMPRDVSPSGSTPNAGDSVVVEVYDDTYGLGMDATGTDPTRAAVYLHVRSSGGHVGPGVAGDGMLYVGDDGIWTRLLCDSARSSSGPAPDKYACDLNDNLFLPGDRVDFYFSATDGNGTTNYFTSRAGVVIGESEARANPDYVNCLPTGNSDILLVDIVDSESSNLYFDTIFQQLGINPDRYRGRNDEPAYDAYSQIHLRTTGVQLAGIYKTILCYGGSSGKFFKDDELVFPQFLSNQSHGTRDANLYISGSGLVYSINHAPFEDMIGAKAPQYDHVNYFPLNPTVTASTGSIFSHGGVPDVFYLDAGARNICRHAFDLLQAKLNLSAKGEMSYGPPPSSTYFASVSRTHVNGNVTVKTMTDGFDFTAIRDDVSGYPYDMVDHIADVLQWFGYAVSPVDAGDSPVQYVNSLSQNFPNPFNPTTTIRFKIRQSGRVKLEIYDVSGRLVEVLVDRDLAAKADVYEVSWQGKDRLGNDVASGVYFYRLEAPGFVKTRKLVLLK